MFRFILTFALFFAAVTASPAPNPAVPSVTDATKNYATANYVETATSRVTQGRTNQYIPTVTDPNELHACLCIREGKDCSVILAASSGICTARTLRRRQPDPCVLRCARYCLYEAESAPVCRSLRDWLVEKVHKISRRVPN